MNTTKRIVVCAACKYGDIIICGARHHDRVMNTVIKAIGPSIGQPVAGYQGFIDQFGVFLSREEAIEVVKESGQPFDLDRNATELKLYSEGLY